MSTELADEIRTTLRESAQSVTRDRLRYADAPRTRSPRRTPLYAALAAAAVVVAVAIGASLWTANRGSTPAGGTGADTLAGTDWRLVSVTGPQGTVAIPSRLAAGAQFLPGGTFVAEDGVNAYTGNYTLGPSSVAVTDVGATASGYAGTNPMQLVATAGINALFGDFDKRPTLVDAVRHGTHLKLRAGGYTLQLSYLGTASAAPATSASNTTPAPATRP